MLAAGLDSSVALGGGAGPRRRRRPTRAAEQIAEPLAPPARRPQIVADRDVLMKRDADRMVRLDVLRQPVTALLALAREAPEQPVPDDQDPAVVAVQILLVGAV